MIDLKPYFRALEERGASTACPTCGAFDWAGANEHILLHSYDDDNAISVGRGYSVIALICDNCGFVRQHFMPVLETAFPEDGQSPGEQQQDDEDG